jgi:hypothetical protein
LCKGPEVAPRRAGHGRENEGCCEGDDIDEQPVQPGAPGQGPIRSAIRPTAPKQPSGDRTGGAVTLSGS